MEAPGPSEGARLCALCGEVDAAGGCAGGHALCAPCVAVCGCVTEKLLGLSGTPLACPVPGCTEYIVAPAAQPGARRAARLARLGAESAEYAEVHGAFSATMKTATVCGIFRVENPALRAVYEACRERMDKEGRLASDPRRTRVARKGAAAPDDPRNVGANEKRLFHATTRAASGAIVREGFDAHRAGQAHGAALGPGIYVATDASFSHGYSSEDSVGMRAMFVCSVLLGDTSGRDSRSDGAARPAQYAVHREQQVLPTHVIHYRI
jgi:Poly(ADP-ribose) polymerase catalytic domain